MILGNFELNFQVSTGGSLNAAQVLLCHNKQAQGSGFVLQGIHCLQTQFLPLQCADSSISF